MQDIQEMWDNIKRVLNDQDYRILIMQNLGFKSDEIAKENNISRTDLSEKWKAIKEKMLRRVVPEIKK